MRMWQDVNGREYNIVIKFKKFGRRHQSTLHMESFYLDIKNTSYPIRNKTLISDFTRLIVPNNSIMMFEVSFEFDCAIKHTMQFLNEYKWLKNIPLLLNETRKI